MNHSTIRRLSAVALIIGIALCVCLRGAADEAPKAPSEELLLETVGMVSGIQLYQAYLNIGLMADGRAEGVYKAAEIGPLLQSVVGPLERVEGQLTRVSGVATRKEDRDALARLAKLTGLVRRQGKALAAFWESGKSADGDRYEAARKAAWKELNALLKLGKASR